MSNLYKKLSFRFAVKYNLTPSPSYLIYLINHKEYPYASKFCQKNSSASFLLGAFTYNVLKSNKLNFDAGSKSKGLAVFLTGFSSSESLSSFLGLSTTFFSGFG